MDSLGQAVAPRLSAASSASRLASRASSADAAVREGSASRVDEAFELSRDEELLALRARVGVAERFAAASLAERVRSAGLAERVEALTQPALLARRAVSSSEVSSAAAAECDAAFGEGLVDSYRDSREEWCAGGASRVTCYTHFFKHKAVGHFCARCWPPSFGSFWIPLYRDVSVLRQKWGVDSVVSGLQVTRLEDSLFFCKARVSSTRTKLFFQTRVSRDGFLSTLEMEN